MLCYMFEVVQMEKRLKKYLKYIDRKAHETLSPEERRTVTAELLVQIQFFQHERLIHLMVTMTFAVLTMAAFLCSLFYQSTLLNILVLLFLVLLIPYIRHYYILENGVQKLYEYYDRLVKE